MAAVPDRSRRKSSVALMYPGGFAAICVFLVVAGAALGQTTWITHDVGPIPIPADPGFLVGDGIAVITDIALSPGLTDLSVTVAKNLDGRTIYDQFYWGPPDSTTSLRLIYNRGWLFNLYVGGTWYYSVHCVTIQVQALCNGVACGALWVGRFYIDGYDGVIYPYLTLPPTNKYAYISLTEGFPSNQSPCSADPPKVSFGYPWPGAITYESSMQVSGIVTSTRPIDALSLKSGQGSSWSTPIPLTAVLTGASSGPPYKYAFSGVASLSTGTVTVHGG